MVPDSPTSAENVVLLGPPWVVEKKLFRGGEGMCVQSSNIFLKGNFIKVIGYKEALS